MADPTQRIHNDYRQASARPTCDTAAYADADVIGVPMEFRGLIVGDYGAAKVQYAQLMEQSQQEAQIDLVLFSQEISTGATVTDNAGLDLGDVDANSIIGVITFASYVTIDTTYSLSNRSNLNMPIQMSESSTVYGVLVSRGTPTFLTTDEIQVKLGVERN